MVGALHPLADAAAEEGQGIAEDRAASGDTVEGVDAGEAIRPRREALEEVPHQVLVVVLPQDVEHEAIAHLQQGFDGPVLGDGHGDAGGIKAGLADPAGDHRGGALLLAGGHHVEASRETTEGFVEIAIEGLHRRDGLGPGQQLTEVGAGFFAALVVVAIGHLAHPQGLEGLLLAHAAQLRGDRVNRLVVAAVGVVAADPLFGFQGRQQGADRGLEFRVGVGGPGWDDDGARFTNQGAEFLGVGGPQVHELHLGFGFTDAAGNGLAEAVAEAVLAQIANGGIGLPFAAVAAPVLVVPHPEVEVVAQQRAVAGGDRVDGALEAIHALHRLEDAAGVGAHQAVVIEAEVRSEGAGVQIEGVLGAVVHPEGIAGVEDPGAVVEGKDGVRPVQVGGTEELKAVLDAALGVGAQVEFIAAFDRAALEGAMHLVFQELNGDLGAHDFNVGVEVDDVTDQAGVVGFGVADDQNVDRFGIDLLLEQVQPGPFELEVAGVDEGGALTPHQKAVVGGAVAQAELNVEAAAVPVQGADRGGVAGDGLALQAQPGRAGNDSHGITRGVGELYGASPGSWLTACAAARKKPWPVARARSRLSLVGVIVLVA